MLVLTRETDEILHIGPDIVVRIVRIDGHRVRLGIEAPDEICILRGELVRAGATLTRLRPGARVRPRSEAGDSDAAPRPPRPPGSPGSSGTG